MSEEEIRCLEQLIDLALAEDLGPAGDVTSRATIPESLRGRGRVVVRAAGVVAGVEAAERVCRRVDPRLAFTPRCRDGERVTPGTSVAEVAGPVRSLLAAERTVLNFMQRLSGIATLTRRFVDAVVGLPVQILDTRKTTPGWRRLEKYAVRMGGGANHRLGLFDQVLIKDNHLSALRGSAPGREIAVAVAAARSSVPELTIEVEVDTLAQFEQALEARPDIILLDNMSIEELRQAVARRNALGSPILLEASGGVDLSRVRSLAETGIDRISVGALTHSSTALDIGFDWDE